MLVVRRAHEAVEPVTAAAAGRGDDVGAVTQDALDGGAGDDGVSAAPGHGGDAVAVDDLVVADED